MTDSFVRYLLEGNNYPSNGQVVFDSSDHIRFQNGQNQGDEGYTVTMYNLDGIHPLWQNNVQMAPKQMKIVDVNNNIVELRGYGYDENALAMGAPLQVASFANYGVALMINEGTIVRAQLNMFDRNICIVYLK